MKKLGPLLALVGIGSVWGMSVVLSKIAVSTGYEPYGLIFWQTFIGAFVTAGILYLRGKLAVRFDRAQIAFCAVIACIGTILPNGASYLAAAQLPGAVLSIVLSLIPMIAFPIALAMGNDRFQAMKLLGLFIGLMGVVTLSWDGAALPKGVALWWLAVALIAPSFYAFEGNLVNKIGTFGLDAVQILFGASVIGAIMALPLALITGQFISPFRAYGLPEMAHVLSSIQHVLVYAGYLWLVGHSGSVFAAQVSYLVTLFGVFWSVILLGETLVPQIWIALALVLTGLFLVQPRRARDTGTV